MSVEVTAQIMPKMERSKGHIGPIHKQDAVEQMYVVVEVKDCAV